MTTTPYIKSKDAFLEAAKLLSPEERLRVAQDANLFGSAWICVSRDGTAERIPPEEMRYYPELRFDWLPDDWP